MRISVICPVKNEVDYLGYSIMAAAPIVDEFIYTVAPSSDDGTIDLLFHMKQKLGSQINFVISPKYDYDPLNMADYNQSYNDAIAEAKGEVCWFLHPDMIVTNADKFKALSDKPLAWWTNLTSYAGDLNTQIVKGRTTRWKNMHQKKYGLHYYGGYGSVNEDFYHRDITGKAYRHYGDDYSRYPFDVANSGINVNHYCEVKGYRRRLEKMKLSLKTQFPDASDAWISDAAAVHPRVTLEQSSNRFGLFEFEKTTQPVPEVFARYKDEFDAFKKEKALV